MIRGDQALGSTGHLPGHEAHQGHLGDQEQSNK
jgi:hypothetical protein